MTGTVPVVIAPHGEGLDVGNAILSRWLIHSAEEVALPDAGAAEEPSDHAGARADLRV